MQSHTFSHAMIATSATPVDFVTPDYSSSSYLGRPLVRSSDERPDGSRIAPSLPRRPRTLARHLHPARSRMSEAPRVQRAFGVRDACLRLVASEGGAASLRAATGASVWSPLAAAGSETRTESETEQQRSIEWGARCGALRTERASAHRHRESCLLAGRVRTPDSSGPSASAFTRPSRNRMPGVFAVRPGDDPFWLKRLPNNSIFRLPGKGRRWWFTSTQ